MKMFEDQPATRIATPVQIGRVQEVIDAIFREDYYVNNWSVVKHAKPLTGSTIEELLKPFQDFWSSLPESMAIRRSPFFAVCDLAEVYAFGLIHDEADCDPVHEVDSPDKE